jgi:hypothetical protein
MQRVYWSRVVEKNNKESTTTTTTTTTVHVTINKKRSKTRTQE